MDVITFYLILALVCLVLGMLPKTGKVVLVSVLVLALCVAVSLSTY